MKNYPPTTTTLSREDRLKLKKESMKAVIVNTPEGRVSLFDLCENIGVQKRTQYWNDIETKYGVRKKIFNWGLIFNNGLQIKHVDKQYWKLYKVEIVPIRERI